MDLERLNSGADTETAANWVIPGLLPDSVVILEGRGGLGKSTLIADLAAAITTAKAFPFRENRYGKGRDALAPVGGGVLIFGSEDRRAVMEKRIKDAGGNGSKAWRSAKGHLYSELDELEANIRKLNLKLIVLDPVQDFIGINVRNPEETRWMMNQLDFLCEKYGCCIVLIRHMRKDANDQDPMEDGGLGTGQLRNFVRAVYRIILDPDDDTRRLFMVTKFNYGPFPDTLVFRNDTREGFSRIIWDRKPSRWNAFNLMARPKDEVKRVQSRECDKWMKRYFRRNHYRVAAKECLSKGSELGFSSSTIQRTRVKLNIYTERLGWGQDARYMWVHPLYNPNAETDPEILDLLDTEPDEWDKDDEQS